MALRKPSKKQTHGSTPTSGDAPPPAFDRRARVMGRLDARADFPIVPKGSTVTVEVRNRKQEKRRQED